ncbi:MAG: hypothetical protein L0Y71_16700 [Gemmataceae bacterium]|nr:hypothetical protein [Gemmataceae bacterium]
MKTMTSVSLMVLVALVALSGCGRPPVEQPKAGPAKAAAPGSDEAAIRANLAKLTPEDQKLAEEQRLCPVEAHPLGSMGVPYKVMLNDQSVFLCCDACETRAKAHADRTLAKVKQLRENKTSAK